MSYIQSVTDNNFKEEVLDNNEPVLVDFWAEWCGPCKKSIPIIEEIANNYCGRMKVCKANMEDTNEIIKKYKIMALPTLCIFKKGQVVSKIVGIKSLKNITEDIEKVIV